MSQLLLAVIVYVMAAPVLAGAIVTALLSMPGYSTSSIGIGALVGALLAVPVAWVVTKQIAGRQSS